MAQPNLPDDWWICCHCEGDNNPALSIGRCAICGHSKCYNCLFPGKGPIPTRPLQVRRSISHTNVTASRSRTPTHANVSNGRQQTGLATASTDAGDASSESISDHDSVFSYGYSELSQTTIGSTDMQDPIIHVIVRILCVDDLLSPLSHAASRDAKSGGNRLQNNVRRLLVRYAHNLKQETGPSSRECRTIARFVGRFASRISSEICLVVSGDQKEYLERLRSSPENKPGRVRVEEMLKRMRDQRKVNDITVDGHSDSDDDVSEPEDDEYEDEHDAMFPEISRAEKLLLQSVAFQSLITRLSDWAYSSFQIRVRKLLKLLPNPDGLELNNRLRNELCQVVAEIQCIPAGLISFDRTKFGWFNRFKGLVQGWSGETWDWWPFTPYMRTLSDGEVWVFWTCTCGGSRSAVVPLPFANKLSRMIKNPMPAGVTAGGHQSMRSHGSGGSSERRQTRKQAQERTIDPRLDKNSQDTAAHSTGVSGLESPIAALRYVLLLVTTGNSNRLSQIRVHGVDNNQFFQTLRSEYRRLRGSVRTMLSVWRFSHCEFYQCEKFDDCEYALRKRDEYPDMHNRDYDYNPKPMHGIPPISAHEFYSRFYACYRPDPWAVHLFHRCRKANSHSCEVLDMLPKKKSELEEGGDKREVFWGIYAREMPCFLVVVTYNALCILPLLIFFFLWLFPLGHGADLESAAVPLSIMLGMMSLFWSIFLGSLHGGRAGIMP